MAGSGTPLVGRKPELAAVERMLGGLLDRRARALEIAGEPGIGKTRLLSELCTVADDHGLLALEGRAAEFESDVPFGVFVAALDDYLGTVNAHVVFRGLEGEEAGHLAAIFPALHDLSGDREAALQDERYRSYRAIRSCSKRSRPSAPWCWHSTICTGPTTPRSSCCPPCCGSGHARVCCLRSPTDRASSPSAPRLRSCVPSPGRPTSGSSSPRSLRPRPRACSGSACRRPSGRTCPGRAEETRSTSASWHATPAARSTPLTPRRPRAIFLRR